jgi:hypothetical protein
MDEEGWLASHDSGRMIWALERRGNARKLRLFAVACVRRIQELLPARRLQKVLTVAERYADGLADAKELAVASQQVRNVRQAGVAADAQRAAASTCDPGNAFEVAAWTRHFAALAAGVREGVENPMEQRAQVRLLRCIFGNPFRPAVLSAQWVSREAYDLACQAYDTRDFSTLPALADLLEEADCTNTALLAHCRSSAAHVRGCWAIDFVRSAGQGKPF